MHFSPNSITLIEHFRRQVESTPNKLAFVELLGSAGEERRVTYSRLSIYASSIAAYLQSDGVIKQPAILAYPTGIDFIGAFLGCLMAGVIAVPIGIPSGRRGLTRLQQLRGGLVAAICL